MRISDWSSDVCSSDLLVHVSEKYGNLPLEKSLAPAIRIAKEGFPVYGRMARGFAAKRQVMERYPGTREVYLPGGKPLAEGDIFRHPDLAHPRALLAAKRSTERAVGKGWVSTCRTRWCTSEKK